MINCAQEVAIAASPNNPQLTQVLMRVPFGNGLVVPNGLNKNAMRMLPAGTTGKIYPASFVAAVEKKPMMTTSQTRANREDSSDSISDCQTCFFQN